MVHAVFLVNLIILENPINMVNLLIVTICLYGESVYCFYSWDSRKSCDSCESVESRASDLSADPGEMGDYVNLVIFSNMLIHNYMVTLVIKVN